MELRKKYKALRVYLSNTDKVDHASAYETIAYKARQSGLAGATVYKGLMGYGTSSELTPVKFWEFTEKVPVVVEMIDEESKIDAFVEQMAPWFESLPKGCLVTCQDVEVLFLKKGDRPAVR